MFFINLNTFINSGTSTESNPAALMQDRIHYLDSSRGLAAFVVFLSHFILVFYPGINQSWISATPFRLLWDGSAAVVYFFIHSGFILSYRLEQRNFKLNKSSYFAFVWRRLFRIYPVYLVGLLAMFVLIRLGYFNRNPLGPLSSPLHMYWQMNTGWMDFFRQSLLVIRLPNDPVMRLLPQDWSLSIEIAVSLLLPALCSLHSKYKTWIVLFIYLAVQLLSLDPFVFDFSLGIAIVGWYQEFRNWWKTKTTMVSKFGILIAAILLASSNHFLPAGLQEFSDFIFIHTKALGCALFLLILLASEKTKKLLTIRFLVLQGKCSYSIYLVHLALLFVCYPLASVKLFSGPSLLVFIYGVVFLLSVLLYFGIELPLIRLGRKLENKIFKNEVKKVVNP